MRSISNNSDNLILNSDSYKPSHYLQLPPGTQQSYSYGGPRKGPHRVMPVFGHRVFIEQYLAGTVLSPEHIEEAEELLGLHIPSVPFNAVGWYKLLNKYKGRLPLAIHAVPEGTVLPIGHPVYTVETTADDADGLAWLGPYIETALQRAVWYGSTVCAKSWHMHQLIKHYMMRTCDTLDKLPFMLHDFGARGATSAESAAVGGLAHLVNFRGTDTIDALRLARRYYGDVCMGDSIPAAEHFTVTSWGREGEEQAYRNMLRQFGKPGALFAVVSDSYDYYAAVEKLWGDKLKSAVIESGAILVIRPDSGDPLQVISESLHSLTNSFGVTINSKGYGVLNHVRLIQGDGMNSEKIKAVLDMMQQQGFSADNIAFGMGGGLLQDVMRDDWSYAQKCCAIKIDGQWRDVFKDPITDKGKASKRGRIKTYRSTMTGEYMTIRDDVPRAAEWEPAMVKVFENGRTFYDNEMFSAVRHRAHPQL